MARKITCNCCGKEMDEVEKCGVVAINKTLGYGSKYDGEHIEVDICADCFDKLIDSMKICPVANS